MTSKVSRAGSWRDVFELRSALGGSLRTLTSAYVCVEGVWKQFFVHSPKVFTSISARLASSRVVAPSETVSVNGSLFTLSGGFLPEGQPVELWSGPEKVASTTTDALSDFFMQWTPTRAGVYNSLDVRFPGNGPFQPTKMALPNLTVATDTSIPQWTASGSYVGGTFTVTGTVTSVTGDQVNSGKASLYVNGTLRGSQAISPNGGFSVSTTINRSDLGLRDVQVSYDGSATFNASKSEMLPAQFYFPTPPPPSISLRSLTNSSVTFRVNTTDEAVSVTGILDKSGAKITKNAVVVSGKSYYDFTFPLSQDSEYTVSAWVNVDNPEVIYKSSPNYILTTGHAAVTDSGSATVYLDPVETGSWRQVDGWVYQGNNLAQGYWTKSNGPYYGVARFDSTALSSKIDNLATPRAGRSDHINIARVDIWLKRLTSGYGGAVPTFWYGSTSADPGGAQPALSTGVVQASPLSVGQYGWVGLTSTVHSWVKSLITGSFKSLVMHHGGSSYYSTYEGSSMQVRASITWNWTPIAYKAPTWR